MSVNTEKWLVIDDVITKFDYDPSYHIDPPPPAEFVRTVAEARAALEREPFTTLSLDYNLDHSSGGTTQRLVDWLLRHMQRRRFAKTMKINVHSFDQLNAPRIALELRNAGYTVTQRRL